MLVSSCAVLAVVIGLAALVVAALVHRGLGTQTLISAGIAGGICWLAASLALSATYLANRLSAPVQGMLVGMISRLGLPLAALTILPKLGGAVAAPGVTTTILVVYFVALISETLLALKMIPSATMSAVAKADA